MCVQLCVKPSQYLFSLRGEPLDNLLNVGAFESGYRQDHPGGFHDVVQLELVNEFGFSHVRRDIDLVGTDQHGGGSDASVVQQLVELLLGLAQLLWSGRIHHVQDHVATLGIPGPLGSILFLTTNVPAFHVHLPLFKDLDVETDRRDGFDGFAMGQDGQECRLSTATKMIEIENPWQL